jgi:hypothetical protein
MISRFTKQQIADACRSVVSLLSAANSPLPKGVDAAQLMWAIAGNESSFGANCTPRHEPAYDVGGKYGNGPVMAPLLKLYGSAAACSYGPWQIMYCNVPLMIDSNFESFDDPNQAALISATFLKNQLWKFRPDSLAQIGEIWNEGHEEGTAQGLPVTSANPEVAAYVQQLQKNYQVPILPMENID